MDDEEQGFDPSADVDDDDLVLLTAPDGSTLECVLLEIVEHDGRTYAVLTPRHALEDEEGDLLVATYDEDADGRATFGPLEDDAVLAQLQDVVGGMMGLDPDTEDTARIGGPVGEA